MAASEIRIRVPHPSSTLLNNLLGVFGLVGSTVAIGGLTHNWLWGLLVASVYAVVVCLIGYTYAAPAEDEGERSGEDAGARPESTGKAAVAAVPRSA